MGNTSSVVEGRNQDAERITSDSNGGTLEEPSSRSAGPIEVFPQAHNFSVNGGTFNISLSSTTTHSQNIHQPGQLQYQPPARTFPSPSPTPNVLTGTESEIYARLLFPKRHGYPLWVPEPYEGPIPAHPVKGVRVGDVGVVNDDGGFQYLFNICHPPDSPLNHRGVPNGFTPFPLENLEVYRQTLRFPLSSHITSSQIEQLENNSGTSASSSLSFTTSKSEGAILVLPKGADRFNAQNLAALRQYAMRNAFEWYKYVNGRRGWEVPNDALYIVTGCDKCTCWAVASFCEHAADENSFALELLMITEPQERPDIAGAVTPQDDAGARVRYIWRGGSTVASRSGPDSGVSVQAGNSSDAPARRLNQCVFLRGYKIAINANQSSTAEDNVVLSSVVDSLPDIIFSKGTHIPFGLDSGGFTGFGVGSGSKMVDSEREAKDGGHHQDRIVESHITFSMQHVPGRHQPYHPSDVVNRYLLSQKEHIKVALTHDDEWCSVLDPAAPRIPDDNELLRRVLSAYSPTIASDGAFLEPLAVPLNTRHSDVIEPVQPWTQPETHKEFTHIPSGKSITPLHQTIAEHGVTPSMTKNVLPDLVFKSGEWVDMDLSGGHHHLIHSGKLLRAPEGGSEWNGWTELHGFLFDHYLVFTKAKKKDGILKYHVTFRPVPLELLALGSFINPATERGTLARSLHTSGSSQGYRTVYPCTLVLNGRTSIFYAETAQARLEWKQKLEEAVGTRKVVQELNKVFEVETLSADTFLVPSMSGQTSPPSWNQESSLTGKVTCSAPFTTADGRGLIAIGCAEGVWIGSRHNPKSMRRVLHLKLVTQCAMVENLGKLLVLADKSLFAYHIEALVPSSPHTPHTSQVPQKLGGDGDVHFFSVGTLHGRTLVVYMKKKGLGSIFRVLEPVGQKINEKVKAPSRFSSKLFRSTKSEWFQIYREFFLPLESYDLIFLKARIAILCSKGFEIMDLDSLESVTIPQLEDPRLAQLARRSESCRPLGIFKPTEDEFLLCYDQFGVYVDKHGDPNRDAVIEWEGTAERVALHSPYILLFNSRFIEVRYLKTGRLRQIIPGNNIRCIWDSRGVISTDLTANAYDDDTVMTRTAQMHVIMNRPETNAEAGVIEQQIFELVPIGPYQQVQWDSP